MREEMTPEMMPEEKTPEEMREEMMPEERAIVLLEKRDRARNRRSHQQR
jgi:hypothetical protein